MYRRIPLSIEVRKVLKLLMYTLFGLLVVVSSYFFVKTSNTAERGYQFRENQLMQQSLESENRILKQKVLDVQSLNELRSSDIVSNMQDAPIPVYIEPKGPLSKRK